MGTLIALLVFSFLIFFHELGHFLAARYFGVHVEVFSIGFGKRILTKKFGATEWSFSLIPMGGYVRMKGQDDANPEQKSYDEDSYNAKTPFQRIIISFAGPFANFLLAFLLYLAVSSIGVPTPLANVGKLIDNSPAVHAGMQLEDTISNIDGKPVKYWHEIGENIGQTNQSHQITILRNNTYLDLIITPKLLEANNIFGENEKRYLLGISPNPNKMENVSYDLSDGFEFAYEQTQQSSLYILKSLQKLISGLIPLENLGGVVGIVDTTSKVSQMGLVAILMFTALISVNLGVINLLPIPALDGGHILFHTYELITKKPANENIMLKLTLLGWAILLSLMLLGLYNDINRLLG
ncbi:MAG: Membrane-associated zinc metalloprotease [uncultured Sulfurovum sp.]|uniref:Zinc metalloprotease n=1 Tax=uncultured Sulfurovum sp. TaxID=269237 RepID=A0A6S6T541_9BACT|nr:MAG: Membrane-associated zinc metalloprotease [uncultured Sulfurovum sp.]